MKFQLPLRDVLIEKGSFVLNSFIPSEGRFYFGIRVTAGSPLPNAPEIMWGKELGSLLFEDQTDCRTQSSRKDQTDCRTQSSRKDHGKTVVTYLIANKAECHQVLSFPNKVFDHQLKKCFTRYLAVIGYMLAQYMEKDILEAFQGFYDQSKSGLQKKKLRARRRLQRVRDIEDNSDTPNVFLDFLGSKEPCDCRNCRHHAEQRRRRLEREEQRRRRLERVEQRRRRESNSDDSMPSSCNSDSES